MRARHQSGGRRRQDIVTNEIPPAAYAGERRRGQRRPSHLAMTVAVIHGYELARASLWLAAELGITADGRLSARRGAVVVTEPICATHMEDPSAVQRQIVALVRRLPHGAARISPARSAR